jgi:hypothetical protein
MTVWPLPRCHQIFSKVKLISMKTNTKYLKAVWKEKTNFNWRFDLEFSRDNVVYFFGTGYSYLLSAMISKLVDQFNSEKSVSYAVLLLVTNGIGRYRSLKRELNAKPDINSWEFYLLERYNSIPSVLLVCLIYNSPFPSLAHIHLSGGSTFTTKIFIYTLNKYISIWFPWNKIQCTIWRIWRCNSGGYDDVRLLDTKPCSQVKVNRRFGETFPIHLQSRSWSKRPAWSRQQAMRLLLAWLTLPQWWWRHVPSKCQLTFTWIPCVMSQNTERFNTRQLRLPSQQKLNIHLNWTGLRCAGSSDRAVKQVLLPLAVLHRRHIS